MTLPAVRRRRPAFAAGLATVAMALGFTAIPAGAAPPPRDVDYVAVGDSYTAGTGADTIGTTATGPFVPTLPCTQTANGYVDKVDLATPVVLVKNAACHGALLADPTWDGVTSVEDQIAQLTLGGKLSKDTELVSMTAGANDAGVSNVLFNCIAGSPDDCSGAVLASQLALPQVRANLIDAFAAIHSQAPRARIVILGYARLFNTAGFPVIPVDRQGLINAGTVGLNTTIASAAAEANTLYGAQVQYVDVTARFAGHEVNTLSPWLFLSQVDPFEPRNFHPNQAGHVQYAEALLASVNLKQLARP
ncbi:SGNH/GDSL hydrolase family protein [Arthrobacter sp. HS15c]|uniref:SGNH/GDSL hydrolase family protein n=1 Tax=Arthrobacter sp. HS15c TaxID=3230279 RepID=UPI0034675377